MAKKINYLYDAVRKCQHRSDYVRAWSEGKGRNKEIVVQVWPNKTSPEGEPAGDWAMPAVLGTDVAISQAVAQTKS